MAAGIMLETGLKQWLDGEESPSDFYQLVGQPRLCRNRDLLLGCLEEASDYLFQVQNHKDKCVRDRARKFQMQVADARRTISDAARWEKYDEDLIARLQALFRKNPNFSGPDPKLDDLKRWLAFVQQVDPERVEELVTAWTSEGTPQKSTTKPPAEMETQSQAVIQTEEMPNIRQCVDSATSAPVVPASSWESFDASQYTENSRSPEEASAAAITMRAAPPPPPARKPASRPVGMELKSPPPPPSKDFPPPHQPTATPGNRSAPRQAGESRATAGSAVILIVMAFFLTALALGLFGLVLAWVAGALDGNRSRGDISTEESSFVLNEIRAANPVPGSAGFPIQNLHIPDVSTRHSD